MALTREATTMFSAPIGKIAPFGGSAAPTGWLLCDASAVSRTTYASLFAIIGTSYGVGNGSTTFNLPDSRTNVLAGFKTGDGNFGTLGQSGGAATHTLIAAEMPIHTHVLGAISAGTPAGTVASAGAHTHNISAIIPGGAVTDSGLPDVTGTAQAAALVASSAGAHVHSFVGTLLATHNHTIANTGSGTAHNNLQPYLVVQYIIKY